MRRSPSIAPHFSEQDTYLVLDDFGGRIGQSWRETEGDAKVEDQRLAISSLRKPPRFRHDVKQGVSAGISGQSIPGFWSLGAFAHFGCGFWRPVSASKNSGPGCRP